MNNIKDAIVNINTGTNGDVEYLLYTCKNNKTCETNLILENSFDHNINLTK